VKVTKYLAVKEVCSNSSPMLQEGVRMPKRKSGNFASQGKTMPSIFSFKKEGSGQKKPQTSKKEGTEKKSAQKQLKNKKKKKKKKKHKKQKQHTNRI